VVPPPLTQHRIFYTSGDIAFDFDFGGDLANADVLCQQYADSQTLGGTWKALMTQAGGSMSDRLTIVGPVYNLNSDLVAANETNLYTTPDGAVNYNEKAELYSGGANIFLHGTEQGGVSGPNNCLDWTTTSSGINTNGSMVNGTSAWLVGWLVFGCGNENIIVCIDQ